MNIVEAIRMTRTDLRRVRDLSTRLDKIAGFRDMADFSQMRKILAFLMLASTLAMS